MTSTIRRTQWVHFEISNHPATDLHEKYPPGQGLVLAAGQHPGIQDGMIITMSCVLHCAGFQDGFRQDGAIRSNAGGTPTGILSYWMNAYWTVRFPLLRRLGAGITSG